MANNHTKINDKIFSNNSVKGAKIYTKVIVQTFCNKFLKHAKNYAKDSNLHGLRYVTAKGNKYEKIFWGVLCLACTIMTVIMINLMSNRFYESPTITTIESTNYPINKVEFPAVSICSIYPVSASSAKKMMEIFTSYNINIPAPVIENFLFNLSSVYRVYDAYINNEEVVRNMSAVMDKLGYDLETFLFELAMPCEEMLIGCGWLGQDANCTNAFQTVKTQFGFCCSFNWRGEQFTEYSNLKIRTNLKVDTVRKESIYVSGASSPVSGLRVWIDLDKINYLFKTPAVAVILHGPTQYPDINLRYAVIRPAYRADFSIRPQVIESSPNVRSLSVRQRQCFFPEEDPLHTKQNYSYDACELQFKIRFLLQKCGCVPYNFPTSEKMRTCGLQDLKCVWEKISGLENADPQLKDENWTVGSSDHCLENCYSVRYDWSLRADRYAELDASEVNINISEFWKNKALINVYFENKICIKYRTESLITWESLIASFGGLFGLFLGGSVVSLIEIIYHFTYAFLKENRKQKAKRGRRKRTKNRSRKQETNISRIESSSDINCEQKITSNNFHIGNPEYSSAPWTWIDN